MLRKMPKTRSSESPDMTEARPRLAWAMAALILPLIAGLAGCEGQTESGPVGKIAGDEAQTLVEAESMLAEQRMPQPADDYDAIPEGINAAPAAAAEEP